MSAYNTLSVKVSCPSCKKVGEFEIQFKYGNTWQYQYKVGDSLKWGGNQVGQPGAKRVLVHGIGGPCPACKSDNLPFEITVEENEITGAKPSLRDNPDSEEYQILK